MTHRHLSQSLHILGPLLGERVGVNVRIGGAKAATDGNTIYLPSLPLDHAEAEALGFGLVLHESNHVRHTDFSVDKGEGLRGDLVNILEDVRIDRLGQHRYPGARMREEALVATLLARGEAVIPQPNDPPERLLPAYIAWQLTHAVNGIQAAEAPASTSRALFEATFTEALRTALDEQIVRVTDCSSTADVARLADEIMAMLEARSTPEGGDPPGDQEGAHSDDSTPDATSSDGSSATERTTTGADGTPAQQEVHGADGTAQTPSSPEEEPVVETPGEAAREREALSRALGGGASGDFEGFGELAARALEAIAKDGSHVSIGVGYQGDDDQEDEKPPEARGRFDARVKRTTNALRQKLPRLLQAESLSRRARCATGRRLDFRRLAGVAVGETRLFLQETAGISTETAVHLLLDRSSSMATDRRIEVAREACYAASLALQAVPGVSVAVSAFPGPGRGTIACLARGGERVEQAESRFAGLQPRGGTPLAEAMLFGARALLAERKPRRILLVITDGEYPAEIGRPLVERLGRAGIESVGVGIACDCGPIFPVARTIGQVGELPSALFRLLEETLKRAMTR